MPHRASLNKPLFLMPHKIATTSFCQIPGSTKSHLLHPACGEMNPTSHLMCHVEKTNTETKVYLVIVQETKPPHISKTIYNCQKLGYHDFDYPSNILAQKNNHYCCKY